MFNLSKERKGELFIFSHSLLGSFFPVAVVLSYAALTGLVSLAWSILIAALFFTVLMFVRKRWHELKDVRVWKYAAYIAFFIIILFFGLYYLGLEYTSPGNAAILIYFQVFTSFLFFNIYRKEYISSGHKIGAALMIAGVLIILARDWGGINTGDVLILSATFCAPAGNYFQQKAREIASAETILFLRNVFAALILFPLIYILGMSWSLADVHAVLPLLLFNGILYFGVQKILWIEGIHRISVTKSAALSSIEPLFTLMFVWLILMQAPTVWQLASLPLFVAGVMLLTNQWKLKADAVAA